MCLGSMHFRSPHAALRQKNDHNSPNVLPIIGFFQDLLKFMKRHFGYPFKAIERVLALL